MTPTGGSKVQVQALEDGLEPAVVSERIKELRALRDAAHDDLVALPDHEIEEAREDLAQTLAWIPDLTEQLRAAPRHIKRQTFEAFGLRIEYDTAERRLEISATITEAIARAFEHAKGLREEAFRAVGGDLAVTASDIAGAGFEPATFGL